MILVSVQSIPGSLAEWLGTLLKHSGAIHVAAGADAGWVRLAGAGPGRRGG